MTRYVALLRGINVGGKHILPMQKLRDILTSLGCDGVATYIQSGNAVFSSAADAAELSGKIRDAIEAQFGFAPRVLLLSVEQFEAIAAANPYPEAEAVPKTLHVAFLADKVSDTDIDAMNALKADSERFTLTNDALYLHAPDGIGRSRLAGKIDQYLGAGTTARNWRTVMKLLDLANS